MQAATAVCSCVPAVFMQMFYSVFEEHMSCIHTQTKQYSMHARINPYTYERKCHSALEDMCPMYTLVKNMYSRIYIHMHIYHKQCPWGAGSDSSFTAWVSTDTVCKHHTGTFSHFHTNGWTHLLYYTHIPFQVCLYTCNMQISTTAAAVRFVYLICRTSSLRFYRSDNNFEVGV